MERSEENRALSRSIQQHFGQLVRQERDALGLKQEDLAVKAGVDQANISRLERGAFQPTLIIAFRVAAALSIHPHELVERLIQMLPEAEREALSPQDEA